MRPSGPKAPACTDWFPPINIQSLFLEPIEPRGARPFQSEPDRCEGARSAPPSSSERIRLKSRCGAWRAKECENDRSWGKAKQSERKLRCFKLRMTTRAFHFCQIWCLEILIFDGRWPLNEAVFMETLLSFALQSSQCVPVLAKDSSLQASHDRPCSRQALCSLIAQQALGYRMRIRIVFCFDLHKPII